MGTTLNNLGACASNLLTGKKYGGVLVNNKLTLVPSKRLTQFVDNAEKYGFGFCCSSNQKLRFRTFLQFYVYCHCEGFIPRQSITE